MDRSDFERLRDLTDKRIDGDILLRYPSANAAYLESEKIPIVNSEAIEAYVILRWSPETDSKTVNVHVSGVGPICRLDIDGKVHPPCGRNHKHSLQSSACPGQNLKRNLHNRDDLSGATINAVFEEFCRMANIDCLGKIVTP